MQATRKTLVTAKLNKKLLQRKYTTKKKTKKIMAATITKVQTRTETQAVIKVANCKN